MKSAASSTGDHDILPHLFVTSDADKGVQHPNCKRIVKRGAPVL